MKVAFAANGNPVPELVDFRLIPGRNTLVLFICDQGVFSTRRIDLSVPHAGLLTVNPAWGNVLFVRGVKDVEKPTFKQRIGKLVGVYAATREVMELLTGLLWGAVEDCPDWQEPLREGVQAAPIPNAAD